MRCRLLLPMWAVSVRQSVSLSVTRLNSASLCKQIKMLFSVNILGGPWNIVLHGGSDPHREVEGEMVKFLPIVDPLHISKTAEARDLKFRCL